jgi:hypothetical protein
MLSIISLETIVWLGGLITLAFIKVDSVNHFTVCPIRNLGWDFCPGCGLGMSIHYFLHFDFTNSINAHPLGIFAAVVLIYRISVLTKLSVHNYKILSQQTS